MPKGEFRDAVYSLMRQVPCGKVTTYGDIAAMAGCPTCARMVGGIAHHGDTDLPWHRLVNRFGGLALGFPGGRRVQAELLLQDGVTCTDYIVDNFEDIRWKIG